MMIRESFDRELQRLMDEVLVLGSMVEEALIGSVQALKGRDREAAKMLIAQDRSINRRRYDIESDALTLIATQQPMAGDLRTIAALLDLSSELERIGDYAKGIAKINLMIGEEPLMKSLTDLPVMALKAADMLDRALQAFAQQDAEMARDVPPRDDEVDELYEKIYRELIDLIMLEPGRIEQANYLLWAAHNLERAADRVTNICERVVFTVTGELTEMDVEEGQRISVEALE
jgi:phosphate transport system protein